MKSTIPVLLAYLLFSSNATAQTSLVDSIKYQQVNITRSSSLVLSGWGTLSLGSGLIAASQTSGEAYHFHRTNAIFGGVNLLLGQLGYWTNRRKPTGSPGLPKLFREQEKLEKLFLFNTALDLVYVGAGVFLIDKGNNKTGPDRDQLRGTGRSFLVQGGFLLLFDGVLYLLHNRNGNRLNAFLDRLAFSPAPGGVGLVYCF
jgi:hypothetical protein